MTKHNLVRRNSTIQLYKHLQNITVYEIWPVIKIIDGYINRCFNIYKWSYSTIDDQN